MNRVDGKVAVVTGGTQGLGKAIAMNLAKMGAKGIVTLGRNEKRGSVRVRVRVRSTYQYLSRDNAHSPVYVR